MSDEPQRRPEADPDPVASNRVLWDEWTEVHVASEFYDVEGFKAEGVIRLADHERQEVGDVNGRSLLHLQCHFGIDTLSWARLGARVTGVDLSPVAIDRARELASQVGITDARFVCSEVTSTPEALPGEEFDIVYTSRGVLGWLPDLRPWAAAVAKLVRPGGVFYITEIHPVAMVFESEGTSDLELTYPYSDPPQAPQVFEVQGSYADPEAHVDAEKEHGWGHGIGQVVTSLVQAGLVIEFLHEHDRLPWELGYLEEDGDGHWRVPAAWPGDFPLMFSLRARKPAAAAAT